MKISVSYPGWASSGIVTLEQMMMTSRWWSDRGSVMPGRNPQHFIINETSLGKKNIEICWIKTIPIWVVVLNQFWSQSKILFYRETHRWNAPMQVIRNLLWTYSLPILAYVHELRDLLLSILSKNEYILFFTLILFDLSSFLVSKFSSQLKKICRRELHVVVDVAWGWNLLLHKRQTEK